jgi:hypothetical protein
MKIKIHLKDPDGVHDSITDAAKESVKEDSGYDPEELEMLCDIRFNRLSEKCAPWIRYGEYVTIEIDTDAGTAIVCKT